MKLLPLLCLSILLVIPAHAVELRLAKTNITMPAGRTFQMPLTASDPAGGPLEFSILSIKPKMLTGKFAPATNRSLVLNVTGVDATSAPFTGDLVLQLFDDLTTNTTARITALVSSSFYNTNTFHRIIQDFVCQGGDPDGNGSGGSGVKFDDEFEEGVTFTGFGQLAMANSGDDSNDSQFFITDGDLTVGDPTKLPPRHLDFQHTIFGQTTRGFDILAKIMETPVAGGNNAPITPMIINTATIITNSQDAVLRLSTIDPTWTGTVTVTVSAMNAAKEIALQTFTVNIVSNTVNDPPFLGPIPASLLITQSMAASFPLTAVDLEDDPLNPGLKDADTGQLPTNIEPYLDSSQRLWLVPDLSTTSTVHLVFSIADDLHAADTQHFSITIVPKPDAPTMSILPKSGSLVSGVNTNDDRIKISGTLAFNGQSDHTFTFQDLIIMSIGDTGTPLKVTLKPGKAGYSAKNGVVKFKSPAGESPAVSAQFNSAKGTFKIAVSNFDFPAAISNQVEVGITVGNDYGTDTRAWVETKPGTFTFPKP